MSKLPPKPKGPLLLRRVLFTSVIGAGCGTSAPQQQSPQPPQTPPQPPQPYYEDAVEKPVEPIDAGIPQPGPPQVMPTSVEKPPSPPPQVAPPPQVQRANEVGKKNISRPPHVRRPPPQVAPPPHVQPADEPREKERAPVLPPQVIRPIEQEDKLPVDPEDKPPEKSTKKR